MIAVRVAKYTCCCGLITMDRKHKSLQNLYTVSCIEKFAKYSQSIRKCSYRVL